VSLRHPSTAAAAPRVFTALLDLAAAEGLEIPVVGDCMAPCFQDGARLRVRRASVYWPGDVVVLRAADGRLLAHRVLGLRPWRRALALVTQGDGCAVPDAPVALSEVLGRVEGVEPSLRDRARAAGRFLSLLGRVAARGVARRILRVPRAPAAPPGSSSSAPPTAP
jgi:hypothetical protein